jgi:putative Mg2+ transporter-C (MgtC) family protein
LTTAASLWIAAGIGIAAGAGLGGLAAVTVALVLFTLGPLQRLESRLHLGDEANNLTIHLTNDRQAVGKTLTALDRLSIPIRRTTIEPGEGASAVLRVELSRALRTTQVPLLIERLLTLKYVERVETVSMPTDPDDGPLREWNGSGTDDGHGVQEPTLPDEVIQLGLEHNGASVERV